MFPNYWNPWSTFPPWISGAASADPWPWGAHPWQCWLLRFLLAHMVCILQHPPKAPATPWISWEAPLFNPDPTAYLPHRFPFLMIDRLLALESGVSARAELRDALGTGCLFVRGVGAFELRLGRGIQMRNVRPCALHHVSRHLEPPRLLAQFERRGIGAAGEKPQHCLTHTTERRERAQHMTVRLPWHG